MMGGSFSPITHTVCVCDVATDGGGGGGFTTDCGDGYGGGGGDP